ncbi:uncharacterized protein LY89DRAFT_732669 [Mollisia scopiformis]|uniref:Uncharacterized protein n=1 Tax=Mollisia scopiformis TaxID=149040 RepID=A0A194XCT8_MOLSC|nr:uncharacterized protein LY89DRAFT_732669 [Mollisia scopiformis]KUJ17966.1 hypothetical protein LY89DRAFT_732669 [Mollisia scopiformis]
MYELLIVRKHGKERQHQIFTTFPDYDEYRTKDLYARHDSEPNLWRHVGRADDTIVFLTGEKVNPVSMEQYIFSQNPEVAGALIAGSQRFQAVLLVELVDKSMLQSTKRSEVVEKIWPSIKYQAFATIPKGTIQRATALKHYAEEFDALYETADEVYVSGEVGTQIGPLDNDAVLLYLTRAAWEITGRVFGQEDNFFVNGMDSLQALLLARDLKTTLANPTWNVDVIYGYPSISLLAQYLQTDSLARPTSLLNGPENLQHNIVTILKIYEARVDDIEQPALPPRTEPHTKVFLLTGSTGLLGSHLLDDLLQTPEVEHIFCLNRNSASKFQTKRNSSRSLVSQFPAKRVTFLTANYSEPYFGLQPEIYHSLLEDVTNIVHNAWPVNFKLALSSFFPQLDGVINFIKFAACASHSPPILFVSSVSAASEFRGSPIPEAVITDSSAPVTTGYGQSKYLSERILGYAAQKLSLKTQIARVGQIAGPLYGKGEWNRSEWFPSLVRSSIYLGAIPKSLGPSLDQIDWIPIDILARILVSLTRVPLHAPHDPNGSESASSCAADVYNLLNPSLAEWKELLPFITKAVSFANSENGARQIDKVSFENWLSLVREDIESQESISGNDLRDALDRNPAFQLLDFCREEMKREKSKWITGKSQDASDALRNLGPIKGEWLEKWMKGWE